MENRCTVLERKSPGDLFINKYIEDWNLRNGIGRIPIGVNGSSIYMRKKRSLISPPSPLESVLVGYNCKYHPPYPTGPTGAHTLLFPVASGRSGGWDLRSVPGFSLPSWTRLEAGVLWRAQTCSCLDPGLGIFVSVHPKERKACLQVLNNLIFWLFKVLFSEVNHATFVFAGDGPSLTWAVLSCFFWEWGWSETEPFTKIWGMTL